MNASIKAMARALLCMLALLLVFFSAGAQAPTMSVSRTPSPMTAGQSYTLSWSSTNATSVSRTCTASGTGYTVNDAPGLSGTSTGTASSAWVGFPSSCTWRATGAGGTATFNETMTTNAAPPTEVVTYTLTDGLGSPVARTDSAGNLVSRTRYEPYGLTASGATPSIGFTGHVNDADTGLVYMQQRYYDPVAGRMLSIDPVTTDANTGSSFNRYVYANNNPHKYVDPDGRDARDDQIAADLKKSNERNCSSGNCTVSSVSTIIDRLLANYTKLGKLSDDLIGQLDENMCIKTGGSGPSICLGPAAIENVAARVASSAIPKVADAKLGNIVSDLFKGAKGANPIGTGSTADAIRSELATGVATGGKFHSQKGVEYVRALDKWLQNNLSASHYDRLVATSLKNDLINAHWEENHELCESITNSKDTRSPART